MTKPGAERTGGAKSESLLTKPGAEARTGADAKSESLLTKAAAEVKAGADAKSQPPSTKPGAEARTGADVKSQSALTHPSARTDADPKSQSGVTKPGVEPTAASETTSKAAPEAKAGVESKPAAATEPTVEPAATKLPQDGSGPTPGGVAAVKPNASTPSAKQETRPRPETHIAEQRVVDDRPSQADRSTSGTSDNVEGKTVGSKPTGKGAKPAKTKQPGERSVPAARLSSYAAEAAKLLAGSSPARRKRRAEAPDPVAEDEQGKESRPLRKGQFKPSAED